MAVVRDQEQALAPDDQQERTAAVLLLDDSGSARLALAPPQTLHSMVAGASGAVAEVRSSEKASAARRSPSSDTSGIAVLRLGSSAGCLSVRASRTPADPPASVMHYRRALERTETSFPAGAEFDQGRYIDQIPRDR
jgi:hypothetical protein